MKTNVLTLGCIIGLLSSCSHGGDDATSGHTGDDAGDASQPSDAGVDHEPDALVGDADAGTYVEGDGHCVRPVGECETNGDGTSWACAASTDGPGAFAGLPEELVRGDAYFVSAGSYDGYVFDDPEDGTKYVTVRKATASDHGPAEGWQNDFAVGPSQWGSLHFATSHHVFDGVTGGGAGSFRSGHGFKMEAADASSGFISTNDELHHIHVRHTEFTHAGDTQVVPSGDVFKNVNRIDDFEFAYNYVHHISGLALFMRGGERWLIEQNYVDDVCGCSVHDVDWHCEHMVVHGADELTVRYNVMLGGRSTGILVNNDLESRGWKVYGNVFDNDDGSAILSVAADPADHSTNFVIVNNVFMGDSNTKLIMDNDDHVVFNNIFFDTSSATSLPTTHDYNYYTDVGSILCDMGFAEHENGEARYPNDCDALDTTGDPFVDSAGGDFRLQTPLTGWPGADLCDGFLVCNATDRYDVDMFGRVRGADGVWDRGAVEY